MMLNLGLEKTSLLDAGVVWTPHTHKTVSALEKIENRDVRWVFRSRFNPVNLKWSKSS